MVSHTARTKIFHYVEKGRHVTVACHHNLRTGDCRYGASIFRKTSPKEVFSRKIGLKIALGRLEKYPIKTTLKAKKNYQLKEKIRKYIHQHGVQDKVHVSPHVFAKQHVKMPCKTHTTRLTRSSRK